jgi:hypothetical protein
MLTHPTLDQLRALRLDGMAEAFAELQARDGVDDLPHADWLALDQRQPSCPAPTTSLAAGSSRRSGVARP